MSEGEQWLTADQFAEEAGIVRRVASKVLARAAGGLPWRGHRLVVRQVFGRGGKRGLSYQVALSSLPEAVQDPLSALPDLRPDRPPTGRVVDPKNGAIIGERWAIIEPALNFPPRTPERLAAIREIVAKSGKGQRTVERWIANYEADGFSGLRRAKPSNSGEARVFVSRPFDAAFRAAGYPDDLLTEVGRRVVRKIRGVWQSRAEKGGATEVRYLSEFLLLELCEELGLAIPAAALRLSRRHVDRWASDRVVNTYKNDRKAFEDAKPRISRDWTGLAPMEWVIADVKHVDVVMTRPDGSEVWPKVIGFMDGGTSRVFLYPVMLAKGEGVRQEHVTEAFLAMVADPWWGFPRALYLDNGSEFKHFEKIDAALALLSSGDRKTIVNAKAYNASAKPIENAFGRLDKYLFSQLPGYAGGDRMNKKTQKVGRPTQPYPGSWEDFTETLEAMLKVFNARPIGGQWGGKSARQWLAEKAEAGWRPVTVDPHEIDAAFCDFDTRRVEKGRLKIGGSIYHHPALSRLPARSEVSVALPWRRGAMPLFKAGSGPWTGLDPDYAYSANWTEGAVETGRRQSAQRQHVRGLGGEGDAVDPVSAKVRMAGRLDTMPAPQGGGRLDVGGQLKAIADSRAKAGQDRAAAADEADRRRLMRDRETERLLRSQRRAV